MKIAYLDTFSGISGDMTLGAFVSAGVPLDRLREELAKVDLRSYDLESSHVVRNGITAVKVDVNVREERKGHRHLKDINALIDASGLSKSVKERAKKIFHVIGVAEAKVHNTTLEKVHFHEVGAVDSIVDIVGTAICLELAGIQQLYASPVRLGSGGRVKTEHGVLPTPTPATLEILSGYPIVLTDVPDELTTPTGAGIVRALSAGPLTMERLRVGTVGYGAGTKEFPQLPNLLRVLIGELDHPLDEDELLAVETNVDDMNPEIYPYLIERLMGAGAHDAYMVPVIMKKGRPGILLSVLAARSLLEPVLAIMFSETTTLGVRIQPTERRKVRRQVRMIRTSLGEVNAKVVMVEGQERITPEFEECKRLALEKGLPLLEVYKLLEKEFRG